MGAPRTSDKIIEYLHDHANINVTLTEIMKVTGLTKEQVQSGINNLRTRHGLNIETRLAGQLWAYRPDANIAESKETARVFELIGTSKAGAIVIQDEDGKLYRAEEL